MKVSLQRHGIVIKTVPISGDRASIGSGPDRDVIIDDPYLAPHVADLVRQADGWHIVDSATSLEGVTRAGTRVDDELLAADQVYSVGGFEIVVQFEGSEVRQQPAAAGPPAASDPYIPSTMMEDQIQPGPSASRPEPRVTPHTMMETELPPSARREVPKTMYEPMPVSRPASSQAEMVRPVVVQPAAAAPARKPRRLLIIGCGLGLGMLLLLIVLVAGGKKKKPVVAEKKIEAPKTSTTATTATTAAPVAASAETLLADLRFDETLTAWETQLGKSPADASLQQRHSDLALEIARIHSANGSDDAAKYYQRVIRFGAPGSEAVLTARRKLGN